MPTFIYVPAENYMSLTEARSVKTETTLKDKIDSG